MNGGFQRPLHTALAVTRLEWRLEWRQGHQLAAVGLFALAAVYIAFQASGHVSLPRCVAGVCAMTVSLKAITDM